MKYYHIEHPTMETKYEVCQRVVVCRMCIGTFDTWDEAFGAVVKKNDDGNYWANIEYKENYFFIVEERLI